MRKFFIFLIMVFAICFTFVGCDEGKNGGETSSTASMLPVGSGGEQVSPEDVSGAINEAIQNGELDIDFKEIFGGEIILPDMEL